MASSPGKNNSSHLSINGDDGDRKIKSRHGFELFEYNGFYYPLEALQSIKASHEMFQPRADDVFLCTALKTGTTWMKAILTSIMKSTDLLKEKGPHDLIPSFGIIRHGYSPMLSEMPSPRVLHTHLPYNALPHSIKSLGCRIIYITRNPKDTFVSYWKFIDKVQPPTSLDRDFSKEDVFDDFCSGVHLYGPYVDHLLGYWNASKENSNVLFLTYEDLTEDTCCCIRRIADFIGWRSLSEGEIAHISEKCSFKSLTSFHVNQTGQVGKTYIQNKHFFRKGEVGDWKNYFTPEMSRRLECGVERQLEGSGFCFRYELSEISETSA